MSTELWAFVAFCAGVVMGAWVRHINRPRQQDAIRALKRGTDRIQAYVGKLNDAEERRIRVETLRHSGAYALARAINHDRYTFQFLQEQARKVLSYVREHGDLVARLREQHKEKPDGDL